MPPPHTLPGGLADRLDSLNSWRASLSTHVTTLGRLLQDHELLGDTDRAVLLALRERLASEKLVLAFVAEFSRGKSELINAIFFADVGRRVLPASPGRTTMCPVEVRYEEGLPPRLSLLPIETRLRGLTLADLRPRDEAWQHVTLEAGNRDGLVKALGAVTRTQRVSVEQATALGLWREDEPEDNPPQSADGSVEVPAWRHAVINYPHPLLQRGLVVIDTPGLNAVGAEPELTLGLLPSAHAVVFLLAADAGVTRSDLAIWREHLGQASQERFVVLNKIDMLADPLATPDQVQQQLQQQCQVTAQTLGVDVGRVYPVSAREALAARVVGDADALQRSRLPTLEHALTDALLPRRQALLLQATVSVAEQIGRAATRRLADRRRQHGEQLLELRGLRGKSGAKLRMLVERLDDESAEFEQCVQRLGALRAVQARIQKAVLAELSNERLRTEVAAMLAALGPWPFKSGSRSALETMAGRLRKAVAVAVAQAGEMRLMLEASFRQLNTDFGFSFALSTPPDLKSTLEELDSVEQHYSRQVGAAHAWRMATPGYADQFRRMLLARLRVVFEGAASELELWSRAAVAQLDQQLRERRRGYARRKDALLRVQSATGDLETRIAEVQAQDEVLEVLERHIVQQVNATVQAARHAAVQGAEPSPQDARETV